MTTAPYSFDRTGSVQVCADGPEILVYSGDGVPMWQAFLEGIAVGVHAAAQRVATIDTDGRMVSFRAHDGTKLVDTPLDVAAQGLRGAADGRIATWSGDELVLASPDGEPYRWSHPGVTAVAFGGAGDNQLGVVDGTGRFTLYDLASGQVLHTAELGQALRDVAYSAQGRWVVLAADRLFQLSETPASKETPAQLQVFRVLPFSGEVSRLALATDGVVGAVVAGDRVVWAFELWTDQLLGSIELHRPVGQLAFGQGPMLGIGLEDGEANRVSLSLGGSWRTNPGFGRGTTNWPLAVQVDHERLRRALVEATAGGQPIAQIVYDQQQGKSNGCLYAVIGFFAFGLICGVCAGIAGAIYASM